MPALIRFCFAIGLAGSLLSAPAYADSDDFVKRPPAITVTGKASSEVVPNIAMIFLGVHSEKLSAAEASAATAKAVQAVVDEIKARGIEAKDIQTYSATLSPVYDEIRDLVSNGRITGQKLRGYAAHSELRIKVRQLAQLGGLVQQLIEKGANQLNGIEFAYDKKEGAYDALRANAARDAQHQAQVYAEALGVKLGRILEIGAPQTHWRAGEMAMPRMAAAAKAAPAAVAIPIEPGVLTLETEVQVVWELLP
jgi:uncharacterized protein YggE